MYKPSKVSFGGPLALALALTAGVAQAQEEIPVVEVQSESTLVVTLTAPAGAEGSGEVALIAAGEAATEASIQVAQLPAGSTWSAFLISGTCAEPGEGVAPLGTLEVGEEGTGATTVELDASLEDLLASPATVQIHPQGDAPTEAALCGEIARPGA